MKNWDNQKKIIIFYCHKLNAGSEIICILITNNHYVSVDKNQNKTKL